MTFFNIYKRVSLQLVVVSQSSYILLVIALVISPNLGSLPSQGLKEFLH